MNSITLPNGVTLHKYDCLKITNPYGYETVVRVEEVKEETFLGIECSFDPKRRIRNVVGQYYWWRTSNGSGLKDCKIEKISVGEIFVHQSLLRRYESMEVVERIMKFKVRT